MTAKGNANKISVSSCNQLPLEPAYYAWLPECPRSMLSRHSNQYDAERFLRVPVGFETANRCRDLNNWYGHLRKCRTQRCIGILAICLGFSGAKLSHPAGGVRPQQDAYHCSPKFSVELRYLFCYWEMECNSQIIASTTENHRCEKWGFSLPNTPTHLVVWPFVFMLAHHQMLLL